MDEVAGGDNGAWRHASIVRLRRETQGRRIEAIVDNERMAQELEVMGYERVEEGEKHDHEHEVDAGANVEA
jgi:hypothetical protein